MEQLQQKLTQQNRMELYKHIELTEVELNEAIYQAKRIKDGELAKKAYWDRVEKESRPIILNDEQLRKVIEVRFENETNEKLVFDEKIQLIANDLLAYFSGLDEPLNPKKGVALFGNVGCGKTTLMRLLTENSKASYIMVSCRRVADEFAKGGHEAIEKYYKIYNSTRNKFGHNQLGICFDDLGTESEKKNFGNQLNVMAEILLNRYDNHQLKGLTHITTNLSADEIEQYYGTRVRSRMREMFNTIQFDKAAKDRRN